MSWLVIAKLALLALVMLAVEMRSAIEADTRFTALSFSDCVGWIINALFSSTFGKRTVFTHFALVTFW